MAIYAIGDVQGCLTPLEKLLVQIGFDEARDTLWFTGDLVNRGPRSLEVLRFIKSLGDKHQVVLGNHDLHLLAVAYGVGKLASDDTFDGILTAPDRDELLDWLRHRSLICHDADLGFVMTHAGVAPFWDLKKSLSLANEVETVLRNDSPEHFLQQMYGNQPNEWKDTLSGIERLRCITNHFTRMRFCYRDGRLELSYEGNMANKTDELMPWFLVPHRVNTHLKIIFGHWAALGGVTDVPNCYALDTGCVWGHCLTAMRLSDEKRFNVSCAEKNRSSR